MPPGQGGAVRGNVLGGLFQQIRGFAVNAAHLLIACMWIMPAGDKAAQSLAVGGAHLAVRLLETLQRLTGRARCQL